MSLRIHTLALLAAVLAFGHASRADTELSVAQALHAAEAAFAEGWTSHASDPAAATAHFAKAASLMGWIVEQRGVRSGAVLHNLGLAHFMAKDHGRAVLALRRAERALPLSARVHASLAAAREQAGTTAPLTWDRAGSAEFLLRKGASLARAIPDHIRLATLLIANAVAWACVATRFFGRRPIGAPPTTAAFAIAILAGSSLVLTREIDRRYPEAVVIAPQPMLRTSPLTTGERDAAEGAVKQGEEVLVLDERLDHRTAERWLRIRTTDGRQGWLPASQAERIAWAELR